MKQPSPISLTCGTQVGRRLGVALLTATAVLLPPGGARLASAQSGALDPTFGDGGRVVTTLPGQAFTSSVIEALAVQRDGRIVAAGAQGDDFALVRYHADGTLDPSFGDGGFVRTRFAGGLSSALKVVIQPDGRIVAFGEWSSDSLRPRRRDFALARYNADGTLDGTFGVGGRVVTDFGPAPSNPTDDRPSDLVLQPDGAIVVTGNVLDGTAGWAFVLARYRADGSLDAGFGAGGHTHTVPSFSDYRHVRAVGLQDDGRIVVGGSTAGDLLTARYMPDGTLDTSYGVDGWAITDVHNDSAFASDLVIQPDGKVVLVGGAAGRGTSRDFYLLRYTVEGALDFSFDWDGKVITDFGGGRYEEAVAVRIDGAGRIVVAGQIEGEGDDVDFAVARYAPNGSLDPSFGVDGRVTTDMGIDRAKAAALQPDGKIIVAGYTSASVVSDANFALARYDDGAVLFFLHGSDVPTTAGRFSMTAVPPGAVPFTSGDAAVSWLSDSAIFGAFPDDVAFQFVTPCTKATPRGKTVRLASTHLDGADEQLLGTAQGSGQGCGRYEVITIPVATPASLSNRRLKLTVSAPNGVHLQLGTRTFLRATSFGELQQP